MNRNYSIIIIPILLVIFQKTILSQVPTLSSPSSGSTLNTTPVTLTWGEVSGATNYEVQVSTDPYFGSTNYDHDSYGSLYADIPLATGTYYWRVSAYYDGYWYDYSSAWSFTIALTPSITSYSGPAAAGVGALISIYGSNFGSTPNTVYFYRGDPTYGQYVAVSTFASWSDGEIDCYVPEYASSGQIIVENNAGLENTSSPVFKVTWGYLGHQFSTSQALYLITNLSNYQGTLSSTAITSAIQAASDTWCSSNTKAQFNIANNSNATAQYYVDFGVLPNNSTDNAETIVTSLNGKYILGIHTTINQNYPASSDLQSTMTHEFGHWIALTDLYGDDDNSKVMYGYYVTTRRSLTSSETAGVNSIYGSGVITGIGGGTSVAFPQAITNFQATISGQNVILTWDQNNSSAAQINIYKNSLNNLIISESTSYVTYTDINGMSTLPVTYTISVTNATGTVYSVPITISSSTINSNTNWQGKVYVNSSVIVGNGYKLLIQPGSIIYFQSGASLTVNGILNVYGNATSNVTFTSISGTTAGNWGSIVLSGSGANNSILNYVNIQNGTEVDVNGVSNVSIQNCNITNNSGHGIYFTGSTGTIDYNTIANSNVNHGIYVQNGSTVTCQYNKIYKTNQNKQGVGILYSGASGLVGENDVDYFNWGVGCIWGGSIHADLSPATRNNRITNCSIGLMVYYQSICNFGASTYGSTWGLNSIYGNSQYNAAVGNSYPTVASTLYAEGDWWGINPPNSSLFYKSSVCTGYFTYPLGTDPWSGIAIPAIQQIPNGGVKAGEVVASISQNNNQNAKPLSQVTSIDDQTTLPDSLLLGAGILGRKDYGNAKNFFMSYLKEHPGNQAAYVELYASADSETTPSIIQYFKALPSQAAKEHKLLLSYLYSRQGDPTSAKQVNDQIIVENPHTTLGTKAMLNNFYIALYSNNDPNGASTILKDVKNNAALLTSMEITDAQHALAFYVNPKTGVMPRLSTEQNGDGTTIDASVSTQSVFMSNYPNPFNPSTIISYQLPANGLVTIKVFDVLGREVRTLVNDYKTQGTYTVSFDASKLASGIYFYQLRAGNYISTKKMLLLK